MKKQELCAAAAELRILMSMMTKVARQDLQLHLDACGVKLGTLDHGVMRLLQHQHFTIKDLSKHMALEPASLVPVVDDLERRQLVRRGIDPKDRRRTPLHLTEEGERLLASIPDIPTQSAIYKTLETMGKEKIEMLLVLMRELAKGMLQDEKMIEGIGDSARMQHLHSYRMQMLQNLKHGDKRTVRS